MSEPQYDQTDADNFYLTQENRELRGKLAELEVLLNGNDEYPGAFPQLEAAEAKLAAVAQALAGLEARWRTHAADLRAVPSSVTATAAIGWLSKCADDLAAVRALLLSEP
jgi:hypothetical protein